MFVKVTADRRVVLEERDNFRAFKLVVEGRREDLDAVRSVLAGTAELADADTAWISEAALRRWAEVAQDAGLAAVVRRHDREGAAARLDRRRPPGDQGACGVGRVAPKR